jgi:hypothetical protein
VRGDNSHVVFSENVLGEKASVRRSIVVMRQPVLLSPLDVKENDEHALDFALCLSPPFRSLFNTKLTFDFHKGG